MQYNLIRINIYMYIEVYREIPLNYYYNLDCFH